MLRSPSMNLKAMEMNDQSIVISIIVSPLVIHQANDTRVPNTTFMQVWAEEIACCDFLQNDWLYPASFAQCVYVWADE